MPTPYAMSDSLDAQSMKRENTMLKALLERLMPQGAKSALGSGMAAQAGNTLANRGYAIYVQEMRAMGQQPLPLQQWQQQQQQGGAQPTAAATPPPQAAPPIQF